MKAIAIVLLAIALMVRQGQAAAISDWAGKAINQPEDHVELARELQKLANGLSQPTTQLAYMDAEPESLLGGLMGHMGTALGHLANTVTQLNAPKRTPTENDNV